MKESILDVLLYLFEYYFSEDVDFVCDCDIFQNSLIQVGFSFVEINKVFDWFDVLVEQCLVVVQLCVDGLVWIYYGLELDKLDVECCGFVLFLEQYGIFDVGQCELVFDCVMVLDQDELDLDDFKWVVLMVLFNQFGVEVVYVWMEIQMFIDEFELFY